MPFSLSVLIIIMHTLFINGRIFKDKTCRSTSHDVYGPYYVPNPPPLLQFCTEDTKLTEPNTLLVHGIVYESDCQTPLPLVRIEVWQADHNGDYAMTSGCRGFLYTDENGYYEMTTIHPGKYTTDPEKRLYRPAHLHFKVFGKHGHKDLVTQMYFYGDSNLAMNDSCHVCSSNRKDLIIKTEVYCDFPEEQDCFESAMFNIVLEKGRGTAVTYADYDYEY